MKTTNVYVTRDSFGWIEIWPETVGIRKFRCPSPNMVWGAAWLKENGTGFLYKHRSGYRPDISKYASRKLFGFIPRKGTAWHIDGKGVKTKVDIDYSN